jgi:hypothetical protein
MKKVSKSALRYLKQHPAWPAVSFVYRHQTQTACRLLAEIIDPRWHVDVNEPLFYDTFRRYLGLGKSPEEGALRVSTALGLLRGQRGHAFGPDDSYNRLLLLVATWFGGCLGAGFHKNLKEHLRQPSSFLLRDLYAYDHDGAKTNQPYDMAFLLATHRFMRFLKWTWLDNLSPAREYVDVMQKPGKQQATGSRRVKMLCSDQYTRTLFLPKDFFHRRDELDAWRAHVARLQKEAT